MHTEGLHRTELMIERKEQVINERGKRSDKSKNNYKTPWKLREKRDDLRMAEEQKMKQIEREMNNK